MFVLKRECNDPVIDVPILENIVHENYAPYSREEYDDIASIRLERAVKFTDWVHPICLPFATHLRNKDFVGFSLESAGFGPSEDSEGRSIV